jgi:ATP-dependent Lhr-like helicase
MDTNGLVTLLEDVAAGRVRAHPRESTEPSPLSHEILNGRPFTFLDDAPLEERRARAVALRRGLDESAGDLGRLDPEAIERVRAEAAPDPRDAEELHQVLTELVVSRAVPDWAAWFALLVAAGRAAEVAAPGGPLWFVTEQRAAIDVLFPEAPVTPDVVLPAALSERPRPDVETAAEIAIRGHLEVLGPCTGDDLAARTGLPRRLVELAIARLEAGGVLLRGSFGSGSDGLAPHDQVCDRRLLARIHRYTRERLRREIEPVTAQDLVRFLLRWQHVAPSTRLEGRRGVLAAIEQLQGFEVAAGAWEDGILAARVEEYRPQWLDDLCLSGAVAWARLGPRQDEGPRAEPEPGTITAAAGGRAVKHEAALASREPVATGRSRSTPSRATPIALVARDNLPWLLLAARGPAVPAPPPNGVARRILDCLAARGALFFADLVAVTGRLRIEVEEGLWELVARGLVSADGFATVRALLSPRDRWARRSGALAATRALRRRALPGQSGEGRFTLLAPTLEPAPDVETLADAVAEQLLARYGVVFRDLIARESLALPWRDVLRALRRLEARGVARGGRFVTGFVGEQYALPEAVDALRRTRAMPRTGELVRVLAVDPLNLVGILTPGPRIPAVGSAVVTYCDGLPIDQAEAGSSRDAAAGR